MPNDGAAKAGMADNDQFHRHRGTRAIQRMVEFAPSSGGLALWVRHQDISEQQEPMARTGVAPVETDGNTLYYQPGFEHLPLTEQTGLVAHAVLHVALRHPQRYLDLRKLIGDVDLRLFTICADAIVNSALGHLRWLKLPDKAITLDQLLVDVLGIDQNIEHALLEWDVERLYRTIDDRQSEDQGGRRKQHRQGEGSEENDSGSTAAAQQKQQESQQAPARADGPRSACARALGAKSHADLAPDPDTAGSPEDQADHAREWRERILRGHANDGGHSMLRVLVADLPKSHTPWEQILRTQLNRSLSPRPDISWSRPARSYIANQGRSGPGRRMPWEPGFSSTKSVPRLVVIVDVSGSIEDELMERFAREIEAITRRQEASLILVIGDDKVQHVAHFAPGHSDLRKIDFNGGGGTDFTPLLEEADQHRPDIVVVLTDLDGPARFRPRCPVIWAVPEAYRMAEEPFGRKLTLS
jgi:predicted metal-dependent peptidase